MPLTLTLRSYSSPALVLLSLILLPATSLSQGAKQDQSTDGPYKTAEVTRKALITSKPEPSFTEEARRNGTEGVVRLRAVLSVTGQVTNIVVVKGLPDGLTEKAIVAATKIRFKPAEKDGRPVSQYVTLEYNFNIFYHDEEVTKKPVIIDFPQPEYTEEARAHKTEGEVILDVYLDKSGVAYAVVDKGLPYGLTDKAIEAARRIMFVPGEFKGRKVTVVRKMKCVFRLSGTSSQSGSGI